MILARVLNRIPWHNNDDNVNLCVDIIFHEYPDGFDPGITLVKIRCILVLLMIETTTLNWSSYIGKYQYKLYFVDWWQMWCTTEVASKVCQGLWLRMANSLEGVLTKMPIRNLFKIQHKFGFLLASMVFVCKGWHKGYIGLLVQRKRVVFVYRYYIFCLWHFSLLPVCISKYEYASFFNWIVLTDIWCPFLLTVLTDKY